jgi:cytochrome P450
MKNEGKLSFTWFGPTPRVVITDPELAREVLANKCGDFEKSMLSSLSKLLVAGLVILDGEKWAKHRRILNPAFHAEKLKVLIVMLRQINLDSNFICDA